MQDQDATLSDIARRLNQDYGGPQGMPVAYFITDATAVPDPAAVIAALPRDAAVIFRDYDHPHRADLGYHLRQLCRDKGVRFLVAGDRDLAETLMADGVHLPEVAMGRAGDLRRQCPDYLITAACHDSAAAARAGGLPIDALLAAPTFPTQSHPETFKAPQTTLGMAGLKQLVAASSLPVYALGGITKKNARQLRGTGVAGIAAIRGFGVA
ncbi:thiamine phosphate synthase [Paremcibacter congregatus]|uniref:thiamine phosphate synthase n=1 Tax=Paremcibacter congregatus TaxID=2043170 RepID=UPI003A90FF25